MAIAPPAAERLGSPGVVQAFDAHPEELMKIGRAPALNLMLDQVRPLAC